MTIRALRWILPHTHEHEADVAMVLGALIRGTLRTRDLEDLPRGWWRSPSAKAWDTALAEAHGRLLCAIEASIEVRGRADLAAIIAVEPGAGAVRDGKPRGYVVDLAKRAPTRAAAVRALGRVAYAAEERRAAIQAGRQLVRAVGRHLEQLPEGQRQVMAAGIAAGVHGDAKAPAR